MTVIAWDGITLAADKRAVRGSRVATTTKIWKINNHLVAGSGTFTAVLSMKAWWEGDRNPTTFPVFKDSGDQLIVITPDRVIQTYEETPHPMIMEDPFFSWGSGKEVALGVMAMGGNAMKAVVIASQHVCDCGNGVDWIRHDV